MNGKYFEPTSQSLYKSKKVKMPNPELYVVFTSNKGRKPDTISLSQEFFGGADIYIEIKAKVSYGSDKDNIINECIVFYKVFNEQIMRTYAKDIEKETEGKTAERMIRKGKMALEEITDYVPSLSYDELKENKAEVMQLANPTI